MKFHFQSALFIALLSLFLLILAIPSYSQTTGKIVGIVKDAANGKALPGANVVIIGTFRGAATDIEGYYNIVNMPPGMYDVQVTMMGYKKITKTNVRVAIDQISTVNFELETELIKGEEVIVVAERDILHKEVSSSQIVIDNQQITEAAGVRTLQDFLSTQAAITND